jgi:hypothetical protein
MVRESVYRAPKVIQANENSDGTPCLLWLFSLGNEAQPPTRVIQKELGKRADVVRHDIAAALRLIDILGHVCEKLQKFGQAEDHFCSVLKGRRKQLGEAYPETLYAEQCLARMMLSQGRSVEAEKILEGLLAKKVQVLGKGIKTLFSAATYTVSRCSPWENSLR